MRSKRSLIVHLKKELKKHFTTQYRETFLVYTQFNVLTFINWEKEPMHQALMKLGMKDASLLEQRYIFQDYPILIEPELEVTCKVSSERLFSKSPFWLYLIIIALVISQSVGLEKARTGPAPQNNKWHLLSQGIGVYLMNIYLLPQGDCTVNIILIYSLVARQ